MWGTACLASSRPTHVYKCSAALLLGPLPNNLHNCFVTSRLLHTVARSNERRPLVASAGGASVSQAGSPIVAVEGDIVTLHWECFGEDGEVLESSRASGEPATFEVGTGDVVGNNLYQAFDEAVRGLAVGDSVNIKAQGGQWNEELLFVVPRDHEEVDRLENRYKNQGGLIPNQVVQLSNGGMALVVEADEEKVILDANSMLAGKTLTFQLELMSIERGS